MLVGFYLLFWGFVTLLVLSLVAIPYLVLAAIVSLPFLIPWWIWALVGLRLAIAVWNRYHVGAEIARRGRVSG